MNYVFFRIIRVFNYLHNTHSEQSCSSAGHELHRLPLIQLATGGGGRGASNRQLVYFNAFLKNCSGFNEQMPISAMANVLSKLDYY